LNIKYSELKARKPNVEVGRVYEFQNVHFATDRYDLNSEATRELDELAYVMKANTALKIEISGHADERGTDEYNQRLSERRSKAVVDYMVNRGVSRDKLVIYNFGEQKPIDGASTSEAWRANRRVEFKVLER
jgi:outer membrane protein OmpA-like peptidoglycan-associated protein